MFSLIQIAVIMNGLFLLVILYDRVKFKQIETSKINDEWKESVFTTIVNALSFIGITIILRHVYGGTEPNMLLDPLDISVNSVVIRTVELVFMFTNFSILLVYLWNQIEGIFDKKELIVIGIVPTIFPFKKNETDQKEAVEKIIEEWIHDDAKEARTLNLKNLVDREIALGKGSVGRQEDLIKEQDKSTSIDVYIPIVPIEIELIKKYEQRIHGFNDAQGFYIRSAENLLTVLIKYIEYSYSEKGIDLSREIIRQELLSIDELLRKEKLPLKVFLAVVKEQMLFDSKKQDFFVLEVLGDTAAQKTSHELSYILDQVEKVDEFSSEITSNFMTDEIRVLSSTYKRQVKENWRMR